TRDERHDRRVVGRDDDVEPLALAERDERTEPGVVVAGVTRELVRLGHVARPERDGVRRAPAGVHLERPAPERADDRQERAILLAEDEDLARSRARRHGSGKAYPADPPAESAKSTPSATDSARREANAGGGGPRARARTAYGRGPLVADGCWRDTWDAPGCV